MLPPAFSDGTPGARVPAASWVSLTRPPAPGSGRRGLPARESHEPQVTSTPTPHFQRKLLHQRNQRNPLPTYSAPTPTSNAEVDNVAWSYSAQRSPGASRIPCARAGAAKLRFSSRRQQPGATTCSDGCFQSACGLTLWVLQIEKLEADKKALHLRVTDFMGVLFLQTITIDIIDIQLRHCHYDDDCCCY